MMNAVNVELVMALFGVYDAADMMKEIHKSSELRKALKTVRDLEHRAILVSVRQGYEPKDEEPI